MCVHTAERYAGLAGLCGALLFFCGDMLFYGHLGSGREFSLGLRSTVAEESIGRLFLGGLIGPLAACLCLIGFWHVYRNLRRTSAMGTLTISALCFFIVSGGAV